MTGTKGISPCARASHPCSWPHPQQGLRLPTGPNISRCWAAVFPRQLPKWLHLKPECLAPQHSSLFLMKSISRLTNKDYGSKWRLLGWEQTRVFYSQLAIARESPTMTCLWQRFKARQGKWKSFIGRKRESFRYALIRDGWYGEAGKGSLEAGHLSWLPWGHIIGLLWLVLSWKQGWKREADSHWARCDHLGHIPADVVVWLPRPVATEVVSLGSIIIYNLAIVYSDSQNGEQWGMGVSRPMSIQRSMTVQQ